MKIQGIRTIDGPSIYSHHPVLVMRLDLEDLAERESHEIPGFVDRLVAALPGVCEHTCGLGYAGGFVERLRGGTYFGHVVEHVALELSDAIGKPVNHGKTRAAGPPNLYDVVVEYGAEHGMRCLLETAVAFVDALVRDEPFALDPHLDRARQLVDRTELGPSTRAIVAAAARRGIPWRRLDDLSLVQLGTGKYRRLVQAAATDRTSLVAADAAGDKESTKRLLEAAAIPVPSGELVRSEAEARAAFARMRPPVVVKPHDGHQGNGVSIGLEREDDVAAAYRIAARYARTALVEEAFVGRDYRVLVVDGRVVAASERVPPFVVGDGRHTIAELVEIENRNPRRGEGHARELTRLETCPVSLASLARRGLGPESVPATGDRVPLLETANLSKGGTARDVTDEVHPTVRRMCERAARALGLDICGVDLVLPDIAAPVAGERAGVIELNAAPGLRMHTHPSEGRPRDVGGAIVEMLFPEGAPSRVPVVAITGTNGKTTTTRMVGAAFAEAGRTVGMTTTDGVWIAGEQVAKGDMTGSWSARLVLGDPLVEVAVLETARGGIVRRGLGWDWCDVAVMTNVQADHLGQDGVETLDDMLWVKSLVAERVREGGTLVLNADDERLASLPEHRRIARIRRTIVFFSLHERSVVVRRHRSRGGTAFFVRDGWIVEATGASERRVVEVASIPATMDGAADYNVANALGAAAACRALGLPRATVAAAFARFGGPEANPGRTNLFRVGEGHVLVDYGHNADGYRAVARAARRVARGPVTGILSLPGDRLDEALVEAARVAADAFDRVVICEDEDPRGREPGEVPRLLFDAVRAQRPDRECVIALDQAAALEAAVVRMRPGELVVVFYDTLSPILETLERLGATPADVPGSGAESDRMTA